MRQLIADFDAGPKSASRKLWSKTVTESQARLLPSVLPNSGHRQRRSLKS